MTLHDFEECEVKLCKRFWSQHELLHNIHIYEKLDRCYTLILVKIWGDLVIGTITRIIKVRNHKLIA